MHNAHSSSTSVNVIAKRQKGEKTDSSAHSHYSSLSWLVTQSTWMGKTMDVNSLHTMSN